MDHHVEIMRNVIKYTDDNTQGQITLIKPNRTTGNTSANRAKFIPKRFLTEVYSELTVFLRSSLARFPFVITTSSISLDTRLADL